jgi:hypothetical protein
MQIGFELFDVVGAVLMDIGRDLALAFGRGAEFLRVRSGLPAGRFDGAVDLRNLRFFGSGKRCLALRGCKHGVAMFLYVGRLRGADGRRQLREVERFDRVWTCDALGGGNVVQRLRQVFVLRHVHLQLAD